MMRLIPSARLRVMHVLLVVLSVFVLAQSAENDTVSSGNDTIVPPTNSSIAPTATTSTTVSIEPATTSEATAPTTSPSKTIEIEELKETMNYLISLVKSFNTSLTDARKEMKNLTNMLEQELKQQRATGAPPTENGGTQPNAATDSSVTSTTSADDIEPSSTVDDIPSPSDSTSDDAPSSTIEDGSPALTSVDDTDIPPSSSHPAPSLSQPPVVTYTPTETPTKDSKTHDTQTPSSSPVVTDTAGTGNSLLMVVVAILVMLVCIALLYVAFVKRYQIREWIMSTERQCTSGTSDLTKTGTNSNGAGKRSRGNSSKYTPLPTNVHDTLLHLD